ncbi:MAG TPA: ice-binding family protein [Candidatus Limnocylindria bacterium]|jgi:hypothetical protein|nr:ice-binding family protein [Candidatus Limnocylindria bacterium]
MNRILSALPASESTRAWLGIFLGWIFICFPQAFAAQAPIALGSAASYGVLGAATVTSTGGTEIVGDLGVSPGTAITGAPVVSGSIHSADTAAAKAQVDLTLAYVDAASRNVGSITVAGNLGGQTLGPGLYSSASSLEISSGDLTLAGDANAVWIFQMGSTLVTTTGHNVILTGGARAANVFWQVGSSATLGKNSSFQGTIMALQSITMVTGATLDGRALARVGQVSLDSNTITVPHAIYAAGTVVAWGDNNHGQSSVPASLVGVKAVAAGANHTVALKSDGTVVAWGDNSVNQITLPPGLAKVTAIAAGGNHTVALKSDGTVAAWGDNSFGQITVPVGLNDVTAIAVGFRHTIVLRSNGTLKAWGDDSFDQTTIPVGLTGVTDISAGDGHSVALKSDGTVVAWGADGFFHQASVPPGLKSVIAIAAGGDHTLALKSDGTVVAWGSNLFGQSSVPAGLKAVTAIAAGKGHSLALKSDGTVVAWGWNDNDQNTTPANLGGITALAGGWYHSVALVGPILTEQPLAQTFALGGGVTLSVAALGSGLSYQWQFNGKNIAGATNPILNLSALSSANAGAYHVIVSSTAGGSVTSHDAVLQLLSFGDLKLYAGITLTGTVGQKFRVDYAEVVIAGPTNWLVLTNITLPVSPYLVIDPQSPAQAKRFYRAVPL